MFDEIANNSEAQTQSANERLLPGNGGGKTSKRCCRWISGPMRKICNESNGLVADLYEMGRSDPQKVIFALNMGYDSSKLFTKNLTDPIISRFDIMYVVKADIVDPVTDEMLTTCIVDSHFKSQPKGCNLDDMAANNSDEDADTSPIEADTEIIPQDIRKKYLTYAKLNVFPKLQDAGLDRLIQIYPELRSKSSHGQGVPIAVRHIESMIRIPEANAP